MKNLKDLKIALVHDFLIYPGGAEKVLKALAEIFPEAPIYTLLYDPEKMRGMFRGKKIVPSYLQKFPKFIRKKHRWLLPFYPSVPETFDLRDYDLVISSSGAWTKGIVTKLNTIHIAYIHSPMRFVWDYNERYDNRSKNLPVRILLNYLRLWDHGAAQRPDYLIANSKYTQERIAKYYRRESQIIYPPAYAEATAGKPANITEVIAEKLASKNKGYFLVVSRLSPYKKVDLVIEAFNKLDLPLVIIGEGREEKRLRQLAGPKVKILGWQNEEIKTRYYSGARAFIFPAEDDFGITAVEAMSFGVPVIAFRQGGAREIIEEGITGEFFDAQTPEVLADGVRKFIQNETSYRQEVIREKSKNFSAERFKNELVELLASLMQKSNSN